VIILIEELADEFDPDRFIDARLQKYLIPNPFIFVPFNAGPRICLGQQVINLSRAPTALAMSYIPSYQFAYHEVSFFLVRLLQRFSGFSLALDAQPEGTRPPAEWSTCGGTKGRDKIWPATHLTLYIKVWFFLNLNIVCIPKIFL
jgi:hypothetical protein